MEEHLDEKGDVKFVGADLLSVQQRIQRQFMDKNEWSIPLFDSIRSMSIKKGVLTY